MSASMAAATARAQTEAARTHVLFVKKENAIKLDKIKLEMSHKLDKAKMEADLEVLQHEKEQAAALAQAEVGHLSQHGHIQFHFTSQNPQVTPWQIQKSHFSLKVVDEGDDVTLSCSYKDFSGTVENLHWYRQYLKSKPEYLIYIYPHGLTSNPVPRLSPEVDENNKEVDLIITSAALSDFVLYYCALRPQ
ncbi:T cell receptor alpha chain MC.7.G5 [Tachysurus ichikawai]